MRQNMGYCFRNLGRLLWGIVVNKAFIKMSKAYMHIGFIEWRDKNGLSEDYFFFKKDDIFPVGSGLTWFGRRYMGLRIFIRNVYSRVRWGKYDENE
jgi:hypothetical protein